MSITNSVGEGNERRYEAGGLVKETDKYGKQTQYEWNAIDKVDDENYLNRRNELLEIIKKVPYPDQPEQIILWYLKQTEAFLVLEELSDELLDYALDFFQDGTLTYNEKKVVAYVLIGVEFEKYKYFLRDLTSCFLNGGNLNADLVGFCIYSGHQELGIRGNFQDPVIKEVLEAWELIRPFTYTYP